MADVDALAIIRTARRQADYFALDDSALSPDSLRHSPQALLELSRARAQQGHLTLAGDLLRRAAELELTDGLILLVRLDFANLQVRTAMTIREAIAEARDAMEHIGSGVTAAERLDARRLEARLVGIGIIHYEIDANTARESQEAIPAIAAGLEVEGCEDEAWGAWRLYALRDGDRGRRIRDLRQLATDAERSGRLDVAAFGLLDAARALLESGGSSDAIHRELSRADELFARCKHRTGGINVAVVRKQLAVQREGAGLEGFDECLSAFADRRDYNGHISLLLDLIQHAARRGLLSLSASYREQALDIARETGDGMALDNVRMAVIDDFVRKANFGKAIELCEEALALPMPEVRRAAYHQLLGTTFGRLRDARSLDHLERATRTLEAIGAFEIASDASAQLASSFGTSQRAEDLPRARQLLADWLDRDKKAGRYAEAFRKCVQLAQLEIQQFPLSPEHRFNAVATIQRTLDEAARFATQIHEGQLPGSLGQLEGLRAQLALADGDHVEAARCWERAATAYVAAGLELEAAGIYYLLGCFELNAANVDLHAYFPKAEDHLRAALEYYSRSGMREWTADSRLMLARLWANATPYVTEDAREKMLAGALATLGAAESDWTAVRIDSNWTIAGTDFAVGSMRDVQEVKQSFGERSHDVNDLALRILFHQGMTEEIWDWAQRSKARGLAEAMGQRSVQPATVLERLTQSPESYERLKRELELVDRSRHVSASDRPQINLKLAQVRAEMKADPELDEYVSLRGGAVISRGEVQSLLPLNAVSVDWITVGSQLMLVALRSGREPRLFPLELSVESAAGFVRSNLGPNSFRQTLRDMPEILRELDVLVAPLAECSEPDDLLILAPTAPLHAVPLHALHLGGQPLLKRNPIAYVPSLTVLKHCLLRGSNVGSKLSAAFVGDPLDDRPDARLLADTLSKEFNATVIAGSDVTSQSFARLLQEHDIVHYQGHARHDRDNPLASHFPFAADERFSVGDLYTLTRVPTALLTLAACDTASTAVSSGDEPRGFVPGLLVAGASAVVASLWPANSAATTEIMREFYGRLRAGAGKAAALRSAMLAAAATTQFEKPYYWAPFVLNGDWR